MPFPLLYLFSDFIFLIVYRLVGYRKKVVRENLLNAFPTLTNEERLKIEKDFYHHLCDTILETTKLISFTEAELKKRVKLKNSERFYELIKEGRNISIVFAHYHNWEWFSQAIPLYTPIKCFGIYKPLSNTIFDKMFYDMRIRFGIKAIPMKTAMRTLIKESTEQFSISIIADQTPSNSESSYWTTFLNQPTPIFMGTEKISEHFDNVVAFIDIRQVKRGYLEFEFVILAESTVGMKEYEITELHTRFLEKRIIEKPAFWLWSHRRWKHKPTDAIKEKYHLS